MAVLLVHIRPENINLQEENLIYTWWCSWHLVFLMRGGPGPRAFPTTYYREKKVKWGGDLHFPVSDLLPGRLLFIPEGGISYTNDHNIKYHRTSQAQNTLIYRAEIKQHDSFSTVIFTTGSRAFYYSLWNGNHLCKVICIEFLWRSDCHFMLLWPMSLAKISWRSGQKQNTLWSLNVH